LLHALTCFHSFTNGNKWLICIQLRIAFITTPITSAMIRELRQLLMNRSIPDLGTTSIIILNKCFHCVSSVHCIGRHLFSSDSRQFHNFLCISFNSGYSPWARPSTGIIWVGKFMLLFPVSYICPHYLLVW